MIMIDCYVIMDLKITSILCFTLFGKYVCFLTGIVQGGTLPYICTQIVTIVDQEQNKVLWTPLGSP